MTDLEGVTQIAEVMVKRNKEACIIERFDMSDCNPIHTPGTAKGLKSQPDGSLPVEDQATKLYQAIVGSSILLTQCTIFGIAFGTMKSARRMAKPTAVYMGGLKRNLRSRRATPNLPIIQSTIATAATIWVDSLMHPTN